MRWEPKQYQIVAMQYALENSNCGLFMGMGSGKSSVVLGVLSVLKEKGHLRRAIVIAPSRVCNNVWPQEREKWEDFHNLSMSVLHGPKKDRLLEAFDHDIAVISVDSLEWAIKAGVFERVNPDVLILDESSFVKSHTSKRFRLLRGLLPRFRRRIILTGTPSPNGAMDLWSQMYVVDRGGALEPFITRFRGRYFQDMGYQYPDWQLMPGAFDKIGAAIKPLVFRADDPEVRALLPDVILNEIPVTLEPTVRKKYDALADDFFLMMEEGEVNPANAAALSQKLRMVCNGAVYVDNGGTRENAILHDGKLEALDSIVGEANGKPLLVFYEFIVDRDRILSRYSGSQTIGTDTSEKIATELIDKFNRGEISMLVVHPQSAGFGLNLQEACNEAVWFGPTWNCGLYEQAIARIARQGQKEKSVTIHTIVADRTIEQQVAKALAGKVSSQKELLASIRRL
ncbi:MAG TPA: SNF2-related protein, partial [Pirellulaceae bacterium]